MNDAIDRASPHTTHTITPHLVVRGAAEAAAWYQEAFGAQVGSKIPVPGGKFIQIELRLGDSAGASPSTFTTSRPRRSSGPQQRCSEANRDDDRLGALPAWSATAGR
jgi:hypothetical protein